MPAGWPEVHVIELPKKVVVGEGIIEKTGEIISQIYGSKLNVLVVTGPRVKKLVLPLLEDSIARAGLELDVTVVDNASIETARKVADYARREGFRLIAGLGGGKSIDVAKYAAAEAGAEFISIPTVASHDGITSPFASLKGFEKPVSKKAKPPSIIILDVDVISKAPRRYNVAGFGDLIGKITAVRDWRLAHRLRGEYYGEYAASLALLSARHVSQYVHDIAAGTKEGYRVLLEALVSSGVAMGIAGSSRPASGSEHLFAHALFTIARNPPLHGEAVGVGTIMMSHLHALNWRRIRRLLETVGAPVTAEQLGVSEDEIIEALVRAASIRPERYTILGEQGLTWDAARRLAKTTGVI